jgi:serine phosphatase RsbU (regulator of sigma subunit)
MFFKKPTPPPAAPSAEERAAMARQQQTAKLRQALESDPAFQLTTLDGLGWICPYTGTVVKAPFGWQDQALAHLLSTQPWTKTQKKSLEQLKAVRWLFWLKQQIPDEQRLGIFGADKRWLNPFTGQWERLQRMHHELTDDCVKDIAVALSRCDQASSLQMLPGSKLEAIASRKETEAARSEISLDAGGRATVRSSRDASRTNIERGNHPDDDLRKAAGIIHKMLAPMPDIPGYSLVVHYEPHSSVGGDFYECAKLADGRTLLMVGDVTGHGVQGAMVVVAALKGLRHVLKQVQDPIEILAQLGEDLKSDLIPGQFITIFMAVLDPRSHELTCYSAGHHAAVRSGTARDAVLERIVAKGPAIGLVPGSILRQTIKPVHVSLEPGDQVVIWTDGLTENPNDLQEEFGDWRAMGAVISCVEKGADEAVAQMVAEARSWGKAHFSDDCTVLGLQRMPLAEEAI